jgi:2-dehydropantoate 2-reductase
MTTPIVIWGAGAIGGTIGAHLARAGHDVIFVDRVAEHVAAIADRRLVIDGPVSHFTTGAPAFTPEGLKGQFDLILLAVKAQHTVEASRMLAPHLAATGAVVSCQNGLNEPDIAAVVGRERTIGAIVNFGADWIEPGHITFGGRGAVVVGELDGARTARVQNLHTVLRDFEPDAVLTDNIFGYLWSKLAYGTILKAQALTNETIGGFIADPAMRPLILTLVREVLQVAVAEKVTPMAFQAFDPAPFLREDWAGMHASLDAIVESRKNSAKVRSGIWRDLAVRHRPTEVRHQLAPVIAAAHRHGLAVPSLEAVVALVGEVETGKSRIGEGLIERLIAVSSTSPVALR